MPTLLIAAAGMAVLLVLALAAVRRRPRSTYTADHAAAGPLLDRTEPIL